MEGIEKIKIVAGQLVVKSKYRGNMTKDENGNLVYLTQDVVCVIDPFSIVRITPPRTDVVDDREIDTGVVIECSLRGGMWGCSVEAPFMEVYEAVIKAMKFDKNSMKRMTTLFGEMAHTLTTPAISRWDPPVYTFERIAAERMEQGKTVKMSKEDSDMELKLTHVNLEIVVATLVETLRQRGTVLKSNKPNLCRQQSWAYICLCQLLPHWRNLLRLPITCYRDIDNLAHMAPRVPWREGSATWLDRRLYQSLYGRCDVPRAVEAQRKEAIAAWKLMQRMGTNRMTLFDLYYAGEDVNGLDGPDGPEDGVGVANETDALRIECK